MLYPLSFHPIFKERVWGGRELQRRYGKLLPPGAPIGESWEICDRPEEASVVANGPLAGRDLHWLVEHRQRELLGSIRPPRGRFPVLAKILDARERLSLQVHPPPAVAARLGGEPKTELWYIADAAPGAEVFVGLRRGVTRTEFEHRLSEGTVAECLHRLSVQTGDAILLPSGRVHALGAGLVIFEVQQNSDTTYRVFDWNRVGLDGQPRELHVTQALESINFEDHEPALLPTRPANGQWRRRWLVSEPWFTVAQQSFRPGTQTRLATHGLATVLGVLAGDLEVQTAEGQVGLKAGSFCLLPSAVMEFSARTDTDAEVLITWAGQVCPPG